MVIFDYEHLSGKVVWNCKKLSSDCRIHHFKSDPSIVFTCKANILVPPESCSVCLEDKGTNIISINPRLYSI